MAALGNDLAFAVRSLKRSPGFVILLVLSLGIALGVTTTMFGLVDTALNPVVPMREVDRLVHVVNDGEGATPDATWHVKFNAARNGSSMFTGTEVVTDRRAFLRLGSHTDWRRVMHVSPGFFTLTGLEPFLGRRFAADGSDAATGAVAMVSFDLWRKALGGRTDLRGTTITVEDRSFEVVGVLPAYLPATLDAAVMLPMRPGVVATPDTVRAASLIARLAPGATTHAAQSSLRATADPVLTSRFGTGRRPFRFVVRPLADAREDGMTDLQRILLAAGILVLLIACGNMANLVLARGLVREREFALRFSLGAGRGTVVRQVLFEALLCAIAGALVGVLVAHGAFGLLTYHIAREVPGLGAMAVSLNWRIFGFTLAIATSTTLAFALVPAWRTSRVDLNTALKAGAGTTTGRNRSRFSPLVVGEVALTMTLMLGASLLMKAVREMRETDFGYNPRGIVDVWMYLRRGPVVRGPMATDSMVRALRERVLTVPGVLGASVHGLGPTKGAGVTSILPGGGTHWIYVRDYTAVGHDYLRTLGVGITEGRDFVEGDATARGAVILNEAAARVLFRGERAVGQLVKLGEHATDAPVLPVVGISRDVRGASTVMPVESASPELFVVPPPGLVPLTQLRVRVSDAEPDAQAEVESLVNATLPAQAAVFVVRPFESFNDVILAREFVGRLFVLFALIGCGLAAVGLYCLLAFVVAQRRREFAVRIALGATRQQVTGIVVRDGAVMVLAGTAMGAFLAMWLARALDAMLYSVFYTDAISLVVAELVLVAVALTACVAPARRAAKSEPVEMLRAA